MSEQFARDMIASGSAFLEKIAVKLGSTGAHLYEVLVRQQFVIAISSIITWLLFLLCEYICYRIAKSAAKSSGEFEEGGESVVALMALIPITVFLLLVFGIADVGNVFGRLINPEYYAIEFIINSIKK